MTFEISSPKTSFSKHYRLYKLVKPHFEFFNSFDFHIKKLLKGDIQLLQNRYQQKTLEFSCGDQQLVMASHFTPQKGAKVQPSLGNICIHPEATEDQIQEFCFQLKGYLGDQFVVGPLCGHHNLGFSLPSGDQSMGSFLTSTGSYHLRNFFSQQHGWRAYRTYEALEVELTPQLIDRLRLTKTPSGFSLRPISQRHFKRDMAIYNKLVNLTMKDHFEFEPLTESENWDLMRFMRFLIKPEFFQFLLYKGNEVGYYFGIPDYHQIFRNRSDFSNSLALLGSRSHINRGRIIYSGILPEFQGQGLSKLTRHQVFLKMASWGIDTIESSYIDQNNLASTNSAKSTGGKAARSYQLFSYNN